MGSEEIDAAKVEALVDVLRVALPKLVHDAVDAFKKELPKLLPNLSDAEWETLKREEDQRRKRERRP
jgi:hypothetical protein